jgi:hypothetical protein
MATKCTGTSDGRHVWSIPLNGPRRCIYCSVRRSAARFGRKKAGKKRSGR